MNSIPQPYSKSQIAAPAADLNALKHRFDLRAIFEQHFGNPKRRSAKYSVWPSPWRDDGKKASFSVYQDRYIDYGGIGESGDLYNFLEREYGYTMPQAIEWALARSGGSSTPITPRQHPEQPAANEPPSAEWQRSARLEIERCQRALWENVPVLNYLRWERGLSDETIKAYRLGWNPAFQNSPHALQAGIVIPGFQDDTRWYVKVRTITGSFAAYLGMQSATYKGEPLDKYLCMAGSKVSGTLFNGDTITPGCKLLFVEGEFDCILAQQELGNGWAVTTLGSATNRLSAAWKRRVLEAGEIYIALDNDGAGNNATQHLLTELDERATVLKYPDDCKDITDYVNRGGDVRAWLTAQTNSRVFPDGAPVNLISAIKTYMRPNAALLYTALQAAARAGGIDAECFTRPQAYQWAIKNGYPISESTFKRLMQESEGEFSSKCKALSYNLLDKDSALQNEPNPGGRPADAYCLRTIADVERTIRKQVWARLYDEAFKTNGKTGIKARPRIQQLTRLGIPETSAAAIAPALDKAYLPIYRRQRWAYKYAEDRIKARHAAIIAELADRTPLQTAGRLIRRQTDLDACILESRLKEGEPTSLKQIARMIGTHPTRAGAALRRAGYQGYQQSNKVITVKPGQNIKEAALSACPHGRWAGLMIDDNPEMQPFEQSIANRATQSIALVIQPPNAYTYVGMPEEIAVQPAAPKVKKIGVEQPKSAPVYRLVPYFGDDISPEVDYNQLVLGLTLDGWAYEPDTGFWYHGESARYCRTLTEAVQIQAGQPVESLPIVDERPAPPPTENLIKPEFSHPPTRARAKNPPQVSTPIAAPETPPMPVFSGRRIDYRAMLRAGKSINPYSPDYDRADLIYEETS